jgi:hypothetical protein
MIAPCLVFIGLANIYKSNISGCFPAEIRVSVIKTHREVYSVIHQYSENIVFRMGDPDILPGY